MYLLTNRIILYFFDGLSYLCYKLECIEVGRPFGNNTHYKICLDWCHNVFVQKKNDLIFKYFQLHTTSVFITSPLQSKTTNLHGMPDSSYSSDSSTVHHLTGLAADTWLEDHQALCASCGTVNDIFGSSFILVKTRTATCYKCHQTIVPRKCHPGLV